MSPGGQVAPTLLQFLGYPSSSLNLFQLAGPSQTLLLPVQPLSAQWAILAPAMLQDTSCLKRYSWPPSTPTATLIPHRYYWLFTSVGHLAPSTMSGLLRPPRSCWGLSLPTLCPLYLFGPFSLSLLHQALVYGHQPVSPLLGSRPWALPLSLSGNGPGLPGFRLPQLPFQDQTFIFLASASVHLEL